MLQIRANEVGTAHGVHEHQASGKQMPNFVSDRPSGESGTPRELAHRRRNPADEKEAQHRRACLRLKENGPENIGHNVLYIGSNNPNDNVESGDRDLSFLRRTDGG